MTIIAKNIDAPMQGYGYTVGAGFEHLVVLEGVTIIGGAGIRVGSADNHNFSNVSIYNYGSVNGGDVGIASGVPFDIVVNGATGTINGDRGVTGGAGFTLFNSGVINGVDQAVMVGQDTVIRNAGTIQGGGAAIAAGGAGLHLNNSGVLSGGGDVFDGIASTDVTVRNTGTMVGDVQFGSGTNLFDGRGGTVNGTVFGGDGVDTVRLGNDGETVQGNDGADTVTAGAGADTIVITHFSANDVDHIHGFAAKEDTFDLQHASFKALKPGVPVAFATGNHAASAADHLFYNAGTGALFYDADGSGAGTATLVARLDTGLHLTSRDFAVV